MRAGAVRLSAAVAQQSPTATACFQLPAPPTHGCAAFRPPQTKENSMSSRDAWHAIEAGVRWQVEGGRAR
jgi:hypothetical protein